MPPHARMSLAHQLLLRAFGAWFWRAPTRVAGRWGTPARPIMLGHFVWGIFSRARDLPAQGFDFDPNGFMRSASFLPFSDGAHAG